MELSTCDVAHPLVDGMLVVLIALRHVVCTRVMCSRPHTAYDAHDATSTVDVCARVVHQRITQQRSSTSAC